MTDRQTQAVAEAYSAYCVERTIRAEPQNPYKEMFEAGWKAAIAASDAKYMPALVGALRKIAGDTSRAMTIAREALSQLPEDLR